MRQLPLFPEEPIAITKLSPSRRPDKHVRAFPDSAEAIATTATVEPPAPRTVDETPALIVRTLHAQTAKGFRAALDEIMLPEERSALEAAEALGLRLQQAHLFDQIVHRLTRTFIKAVGWPEPAIADVVEPSRQITWNLRAITLNLNSRDLHGAVCFRISQADDVTEPIPPSALAAAAETRHYWREIRYLEPLFAGKRLLRSQKEVREHYARPKDPLIVGFLGAGPQPDYGLYIPQLYSRRGRIERVRCTSTPFKLFLIAHYD